MKKLILVIAISMLTSMHAFADTETLSSIALNKEQKLALIDAFQQRIDRHMRMSSQAEIVADLQGMMAQSSAKLAQAGDFEAQKNFDLSAEALLSTAALAPSKEALIAREEAQLQQLMSSDNYFFYLTGSLITSHRANDLWVSCRNSIGHEEPCDVLGDVAFVVAIGLDVILIPVEFVASALTGF